MKSLGFEVGGWVCISGLKGSAQYNGKKAKVSQFDNEKQRIVVDLADEDKQLCVKPENLKPWKDTEPAGHGETSVLGPLYLCAYCKKKERSIGEFKKCSGCKDVRYCGPDCQKGHWKEGGHKQVCGKKLSESNSFEVMVLSADNEIYPICDRIEAEASIDAQIEVLATKLLDCRDPQDLGQAQVVRGEYKDMGPCLLFFNKRLSETRAVPGNLRASCVIVQSGTPVPLDPDGQAVTVRGDAVLVKVAVDQEGGEFHQRRPERLTDFSSDLYKRNLGMFIYFRIPGVGALGSFFPDTPQGQADALQVAELLRKEAKGKEHLGKEQALSEMAEDLKAVESAMSKR
mmetsp:Transcript_3109/g.5025  ORF Transcript_3109/g.5025 Transcript_3109/m.5025 type:complete len:343 (-) Transcript_3109:363-1391(-)|eukprot:CAMPEP_0184315936 /NCGR_PEP_ID=MMETSP1049-20130417/86824_1 /TAXON_ID=77928 /ORGANISM="Proteomonas sulcata, Strain CCMP704" /LENGTH=342 /DNA_ID=CAMNT_0026634689 /DNA_START=68 /DNA_END=1096 /DNA_ORIENTATION=+